MSEERFFWWHWQNLTQEDDPQNSARNLALSRQRWAAEGMCEPPSVIPSHRPRFPWNGRAWWHFGEREASVQWCIGSAARHCMAEIRPCGFNVGVPWLLCLFVTLPFRIWPFKPCRVSVHSGSIWWEWFHVDQMSWPATDAKGRRLSWWRVGNFNVADVLLGRKKYEKTIVDVRPVLIPMPEGPYPAVATRTICTWTRPRWPWWPFTRMRQGGNIDCEIGIPHEGKGENSWDCGEDATHGIGFTGNVEDGIGCFVASVTRDRERYGGSKPGAYPHPSVRAEARAARMTEGEAAARTSETD